MAVYSGARLGNTRVKRLLYIHRVILLAAPYRRDMDGYYVRAGKCKQRKLDEARGTRSVVCVTRSSKRVERRSEYSRLDRTCMNDSIYRQNEKNISLSTSVS